MQSCTTIDATTKQEWTVFYAGLVSFCQQPVCSFWYPWMPSNCLMATANTGDTMLAYEKMLLAWQQRIAAVCANAAPGLSVFNPEPAAAQISDWLKYGAIIAAFLGTAYVKATIYERGKVAWYRGGRATFETGPRSSKWKRVE